MIYSTGVCKSFPPPLVRGGVFLVGLETKYRDIADGNFFKPFGKFFSPPLETKYRDIADGNAVHLVGGTMVVAAVGNQVPRYSGWKHSPGRILLGNIKTGWKPSTAI